MAPPLSFHREELTPLAGMVFDVLSKYTAFPWPVLSTQCKRVGVEPGSMRPADLDKVIELLSDGVAKFTTPEKGESVRRELSLLRGQTL